MRNKVYQVTLDKVMLNRLKKRLDMCVIAHSDYAESKNINTWDDPISKCLADDLFQSFEAIDEYLGKLVESAIEVKS